MKSLSKKLSERFEKILETSIGRVLQHTQKGNPFALISACRGDKTDEENRARTRQLKKDIQSRGFGFSKAWGGYVERQLDGIDKDVLERSVIVFATPDKEEELKKLIKALGHKYSQDSILFVDSKGETSFIYTRNIEDEEGNLTNKFGEKESGIGNYHPSRDKNDRYFTKIKGRSFTIK